MKITDILLALTLSALCFAAACKKKPVEEPVIPEYTITGTILDGTTNARAANLPLEINLMETRVFGAEHRIHSTLGTVTTNDTGGFIFTYSEQDVRKINTPTIKIFSQFLTIDGLPINEDINRRFYKSTMGSLKIYLKTDNPLQDGDTLFLGYPIKVKNGEIERTHIDTILTTFTGHLRTIKTHNSYLNLYWGIGRKNFEEGSNENFISKEITGDPVIDEVTINY